jgi:hypothetical protein
MNDVLEKPLNIENLKIILNKYLNDKTVSKWKKKTKITTLKVKQN